MTAGTASAPGPGQLELLRSLTGLRDNPLAFLQDAAARYGDLVHFRLGRWDAFVLSRPEDIQHVLQDNHRNYTKDTLQYNGLAAVTGRGLLTSDGEITPPKLDERTLFIGLSPAQKQVVIIWPPLLAGALGADFTRYLAEEHFTPYFEGGSAAEGLVHALALIWDRLGKLPGQRTTS